MVIRLSQLFPVQQSVFIFQLRHRDQANNLIDGRKNTSTETARMNQSRNSLTPGWTFDAVVHMDEKTLLM